MFNMMYDLLLLALCGAVVWLFVQVRELKDQVKNLQTKPLAKPVQAKPTGQEHSPSAKPQTAAQDTSTKPQIAKRPVVETRDDPKPKPVGPNWVDTAMAWVQENWVLAVAGISLALAAVFLVQYGIENGLLGPAMRVTMSAMFGTALIGAGEYLRRSTIPFAMPIATVLAASGLIALYVAAFSASVLYGFVALPVGFALLAVVATIGTFGGWVYGPFLSALGIAGAYAVPFLLPSTGNTPAFLYLYPLFIAAMAMSIDSLRGWVWVSVLGLVGGFVSVALFEFGGVATDYAAFAYAGLALITPFALYLSLQPSPHMSFDWRTVFKDDGESFEWSSIDLREILTVSAVIAAMVFLVNAAMAWGIAFEPVLISALVLFVVFGFILHRANAFEPALWAIAIGTGLIFAVADNTPNVAEGARLQEYLSPLAILIAAFIALTLAWRTMKAVFPRAMAIVGGLTPALITYALYANWDAVGAFTPWEWALQIMGLAAAATVCTVWLASKAPKDRGPLAYYALSALGLMAASLFAVLTDTALTMALAVTVACAAALDRKFDLRAVIVFAAVSTTLVLLQSFVAPGHVFNADTGMYLLLSAVLLAAWAGAYWFYKDYRPYGAEVALVALASTAVLVLADGAFRVLDSFGMKEGLLHLFVIIIVPFWTFCFGQLYFFQKGKTLRWLRGVMAVIYAVPAVLGTLLLITLFNPLLFDDPFFNLMDIKGWVVLNSMTVPYIGTLVLLIAGMKITQTKHKWITWPLWGISGIISLIWLMSQVRMLFHTNLTISTSGFAQGEMYIYTILMLLAAGGTLYQAMAKQSKTLRRVALGLLGLTIAKVFLVDVANLTGLLRVFAFLVLGLVLVGLAWLDGWLARRSPPSDPPQGKGDIPADEAD
ncbi:MAG: DUF2339 domain-containing protein [Planktomarina sp.]